MTALITPERQRPNRTEPSTERFETIPFPGYRSGSTAARAARLSSERTTDRVVGRATHDEVERAASRAAHPSRRPVPRPSLVVIEGGRSAGATARAAERRTVLRRRYAAGMALAGIVGVLLWGLLSLGAPPQPAARPNQPQVTSSSYLVRPGDSLWGIATALHAGGDLRDVVDRLAEVNGSATVVAGQHLTIPADLRR